MKTFLNFLLVLLCATSLFAQKPEHYYNDYAGIASVSTNDAKVLNERLAEFQKKTTAQVLIVVYPEIPNGEDMHAFCNQKATEWKVGQNKVDNGVVVFMFMKEHKSRIEVGYGLEGVLPDANCTMILKRAGSDYFRSGNFNGGFTYIIDQITTAIDPPPQAGEAPTAAPAESDNSMIWWIVGIVGIVFGAFILGIINTQRETTELKETFTSTYSERASLPSSNDNLAGGLVTGAIIGTALSSASSKKKKKSDDDDSYTPSSHSSSHHSSSSGFGGFSSFGGSDSSSSSSSSFDGGGGSFGGGGGDGSW